MSQKNQMYQRILLLLRFLKIQKSQKFLKTQRIQKNPMNQTIHCFLMFL
jgi:hypothetical protein